MVPPPYKVPSTGNEFLLKTGNMSWGDASKECNKFGGHLATYASRAEQTEVRHSLMWHHPGHMGSIRRVHCANCVCAVCAAGLAAYKCCLHGRARDRVRYRCVHLLNSSLLPLLLHQVENFYINNGYLFPKYHIFYWMALTTPTADPQVCIH